jgi:UDP-GlcNAc:undecaprenyl-phosphate/decaprenyl-phosphate GlcNAc-1-phosphate transferase
MILLSVLLHTRALAAFPKSLADNVLVLIIGGVAAFLLAYIFTFGVMAVCKKVGWLDKPGGRHIHKKSVPRLGGVAMFLGFVVVSLLFYRFDPELDTKESTIYWLFLAAAILIVLVHVYDDILRAYNKEVNWLPKFIVQTLAVVILLGPWGDRFNGVLLFGFNNPFNGSEVTLFIHDTRFFSGQGIIWAVIPAVFFTWFWMAGMMNAVNWIDGVDGLATGVVGLAGLFITIISWILGQHTIALLSAIFTGAVFGFLPHNWNPAKIFMGDSGAQFLGLGLAVLSIMGGAKVALVLMVVGIPILDTALVIINRIRQGKSPTSADNTHLYNRFLTTGLNAKQICYILYGLTLLFGVLALNPSHSFKLVGLALVGLTMAALIFWLDYRRRKRVRTDGGDGPLPETPSPVIGNENAVEDDRSTLKRGSNQPV